MKRESLTPDDLSLLARWDLSPDPSDERVVRIVCVGRFQRDMNWLKSGLAGRNTESRQRGGWPLVVDGFWGPSSDALYRELLTSYGDRDLLIANDVVLAAIGNWSRRPGLLPAVD